MHERLKFGADPWWSNVQLHLENRSDGTTRTMAAKELRFVGERADREGPRAGVATISDDEIVYAQFDLPVLAPGEYQLKAELHLPAIDSQAAQIFLSDPDFRFSVRRGDEDDDTRRAYLRGLAAKRAATPAPDRFEAVRNTVLELIQLEPKNPGNLEWLGDLAVSLATPEEALAYYDRAMQLINTNLVEKFGSQDQWSQETKEFWKQRVKALTAFRRAKAVATPGTTMSVQNGDGRSKRILLYRVGDQAPSRIIE